MSCDAKHLTAAQVVYGAAQIRLATRLGIIAVQLVKLDAGNDFAVLKAEGQFSALPVVSSRSVKTGEQRCHNWVPKYRNARVCA